MPLHPIQAATGRAIQALMQQHCSLLVAAVAQALPAKQAEVPLLLPLAHRRRVVVALVSAMLRLQALGLAVEEAQAEALGVEMLTRAVAVAAAAEEAEMEVQAAEAAAEEVALAMVATAAAVEAPLRCHQAASLLEREGCTDAASRVRRDRSTGA